MSRRSTFITILILVLAPSPAAHAASKKTYKRPATVPALRLLATTGPSTLMPVPTEAEIERATRFVRETLKAEYKAPTPATRRAAARELFRQGVDTRDDPAARYVLLSDAADLAAAAGDAATVARAVDELARTYQIDPIEMKAVKLHDAALSAFTREETDALVAACLTTERAALVDERYDPAQRLIATAQLAAERGRRVDLKATVAERAKELDALRAGGDEFARARDALAKSPNDPAASLTAGRFLCLVRGEWDKGLPLLAAATDDPLRTLAVKDLENPADPGARAQVGGAWWDYAAKLTGVMRAQARGRALFWYRQAIAGNLSGVNRTAVDERLHQARADHLRELNLAPGLTAELFDGQKCERKRLTRVDPAIDFDWRLDPPADGLLKDNFSVVWTGYLVVDRPGAYTFLVIANDGATLTLDGVTLLDRDDLARKRSGVRIPLRLDEGLHPLKLHVWDHTGVAKARLLWSPPAAAGGATSETPIPPDAFCHEAGER